MNNITIAIIFLSVVFFLLFLYMLFKLSDNDLIKYRITKDVIYTKHETPKYINNYDEMINKYSFKKCDDMCKKEFCSEYHTQMIKYDLCKECKKDNKCYNEYNGICESCTNNYTCEQLYGCSGNKPPINPINNYCTRCWIQK